MVNPSDINVLFLHALRWENSSTRTAYKHTRTMTNDGRAVSYEGTGAYAHAVAVSDVWCSGMQLTRLRKAFI